MHKKRDRLLLLYLHRASGKLLLLPYVCYMGGEAAEFGDPAELPAPADPTAIGRQITRLLRTCNAADIEAIKRRRVEQLRSRWRGETPTAIERGAAWNLLLTRFPALSRGPGAYLRQFSVGQIIERNGWRYRKIVRVVKSRHPGLTQGGDSQRIPLGGTAKSLGQQALEFLQS